MHMINLRSMLLAATVLVAFSANESSAFVSPNNQNNTTVNNISAQGGQGGQGGIGFGGNAAASAVAGASANAGAVAGAVNHNNVRNTVNNSVRNTNTNVATGGSARQGQFQGQGQVQGIANSGNATINNNVPANTTNETRFSGSYTVHNTPDVYAPAIAGGANPCVVGVSGGGAVAGFGISFGMTRNDDGCERRNTAALLHNMGEREVAQELLCETDSVRQARLRAGRPCYVDRQAAAQSANAQPATIQQASLSPMVVTQSQQAVAEVTSSTTTANNAIWVNGNMGPRPGAPAFCSTPGLQLNLYPECN